MIRAALAASILLFPLSARAYDTTNLVIAWSLLLALPVPAFFFLFRRWHLVALATIGIWALAIVVLEFETSIYGIFGVSGESGALSALVLLAPYAWLLIRISARKRRNDGAA
jgi:hypothetical protein